MVEPKGDAVIDGHTLADLATILRCLNCGGRSHVAAPDAITCAGCGRRLPVTDGVLHIVSGDEDPAIAKERDAVLEIERAAVASGPTDFTLGELLSRDGPLRQAFATLPYDDGSAFYRDNEYFRNVCGFAPTFDFVVERLDLPAGSRVLDVGADLTWSTGRLAERGWRAVGIDINHHLVAAQVLRPLRGPYATVNVDMHVPAFADEAFDAVTAFNALHHTHRLEALVGTLARALRPGGRLGVVEPYWYVEAVRQAFGASQIEAGINENVYRLEEWHRFFVHAGFELETFLISHSFNAVYVKRPAGAPARSVTLAQAEAELFAGHYQVAFVAPDEVSTAMAPGAMLGVPISVVNRATAGWSSEGQIPVFASYHLYRYDHGQRTLVAFDHARTPLGAYVTPGSTRDLQLPVRVPDAPGEYEVEIDLVHEARCWFAEKGGTPRSVRLHVRETA